MLRFCESWLEGSKYGGMEVDTAGAGVTGFAAGAATTGATEGAAVGGEDLLTEATGVLLQAPNRIVVVNVATRLKWFVNFMRILQFVSA